LIEAGISMRAKIVYYFFTPASLSKSGELIDLKEKNWRRLWLRYKTEKCPKQGIGYLFRDLRGSKK
jgi:hypothetical protein